MKVYKQGPNSSGKLGVAFQSKANATLGMSRHEPSTGKQGGEVRERWVCQHLSTQGTGFGVIWEQEVKGGARFIFESIEFEVPTRTQ